MKNIFFALVRRNHSISLNAQKSNSKNSFLSEAANFVSLLSLFTLASLFLFNNASSLTAAMDFDLFENSKSSEMRAVGGPDEEAEMEVAKAITSSRRTSSIFRNGKDKSAGIQFSIFPVQGRMTDSYGRRSNPFGTGASEFHAGLDVSAPTGTPVIAAADGVVTFSGWKGGYGNIVIIEHEGSEVETRYAHLSQRNVQVGDVVTGGTQVGEVGSTGRSTGPHLHYEIRLDGKAANPSAFYSLR